MTESYRVEYRELSDETVAMPIAGDVSTTDRPAPDHVRVTIARALAQSLGRHRG